MNSQTEVERICLAALEHPAAERAAFVVEACQGDEALRQEVESLLAHASPAEQFLAQPALHAVHGDAQHFLSSSLDRLFVTESGAPTPLDSESLALVEHTRIGPYEVIVPVGIGGMGEVYRARDADLGRDVALKVLPQAWVHDADRVARFEREARILAALNHPHIAQIYGIERADGVSALAMEFVDGDTLAHLIARGPIPLDEALPLARQLADALESAHDQGIIHRDLKPTNIMVRRDGAVKVLDFGVATLPRVNGSDMPIQSTDASAGGAGTGRSWLFGTPAYISPEQVKGGQADKRTDTWAFGCVLYEMLSGRRAFDGQSVADTMAAVSKGDVDWAALPPDLPQAVGVLLKRCLEKDRRRRIGDVAATLSVIDDVVSSGVGVSVPKWRFWRGASLAIIAVAIIATGVVAARWDAFQRSTLRVSRSTITAPPDQAIVSYGNTRNIAISRQGEQLAWVGPGSSLVVRSLNELQPRTLVNNDVVSSPFFSADGLWIGYFMGNGPLKKISVRGGPATLLVDEGDNGLPRGASWARDGTLVFATNNRATGLQLVSPGGTKPRVVTIPDRDAGESDHIWPEFLPDGRRVLFTITSAPDSAQSNQVAVLDLETGRHKIVLHSGSQAQYVATGHLLYVAGGKLYAVPFDVNRLETTGTARLVVESLLTSPGGAADFDVAADGTLVYAEGAAILGQRELAWVRQGDGSLEMLGTPSRAYMYPRLSPNGMQVLLDIRDQDNDVWLWDIRTRVLANLTRHPALDRFPLWMPDGKHFLFVSSRDGGRSAIYRQSLDETTQPERLTEPSAEQQTVNAVTRDGRHLIFDWQGDLWLLNLSSRKVSRLVATEGVEQRATLSPDERWLAYQIGDSPGSEVFIRPWPDVENRVTQVSSGGGSQAWWSRDSSQLFFVTPQGTIMTVSAGRGADWTGSRPTAAVSTNVINANPTAAATFDVSLEGDRLLMIRYVGTGDSRYSTLVLIQNWFQELTRLVPAQ